MRRKGLVSSPGYRTERRDPQPKGLRPCRSQSKITTRPTIGNHNHNPDPQPRTTTRPTPIEQKGQSEQKGKKKPDEGYRSVMVETKLMVDHIHEREDNRATGKTHNQTRADRTKRTERTKGEKKKPVKDID